MRYAMIPRWMYVMLIVMGMMLVAGGLAVIALAPPPAGIFGGMLWLVIGGAMTFFPVRGAAESPR